MGADLGPRKKEVGLWGLLRGDPACRSFGDGRAECVRTGITRGGRKMVVMFVWVGESTDHGDVR